ncbi:MAG: hypothetical protein ACOWWR_07915 [Eubacteriales bacterium]
MISIITMYSFVTVIKFWEMGGFILFITGVPIGVAAFLFLVGINYMRMPCHIEHYITKKQIVLNKNIKLVVIVLFMALYRFFIAIVLTSYSELL